MFARKTSTILALTAGLALAAPGVCLAQTHQARARDLEEQAETARLNREFNHGVQPAAGAPALALPTLPRQAENTAPPVYRSQLEEYQALRETYDRQLRAYYGAFPAQATGPTIGQATPLASSPAAEIAGQDAARADPWRGYNHHNGLSNGY
ncbi:MAG TPA: hypothetical protein VFI23_07760 [Rhizomicrobium sp.]|nr:hypothetical protein [Rhizomicrobium sp.]